LLGLLWERARKQHGVVARRQLLALGFTTKAIEYGLAIGRLHRTEFRGVYSVGRPELTKYGRLMAAVLWAGPGAGLSHQSAADLWAMRRHRGREIHLSLPAVRKPRSRRGVAVHRRAVLGPRRVTRHFGIPVTNPTWTLIDLATILDRPEVGAPRDLRPRRFRPHRLRAGAPLYPDRASRRAAEAADPGDRQWVQGRVPSHAAAAG